MMTAASTWANLSQARTKVRYRLSWILWGIVAIWVVWNGVVLYRHERQDKLLAAETAFWKDLLYNSPSGVIVVDADTQAIVEWNKGATKLTGWKSADVIGHKMWFLLPEASKVSHQKYLVSAEIRERLRTDICQVKGWISTKDGQPLEVEVHVRGRVIGDRYLFVVSIDSWDSIVKINNVIGGSVPKPAAKSPEEMQEVMENCGKVDTAVLQQIRGSR